MTPPLSTPIDVLKPAVSAPAGNTAERIKKTSQDFEASFMSIMLGQMFNGVGGDGDFTGGQGEQAFKSFLLDAFSKQMTRAGGVGIANSVQREMLKLQGLEG